MIERQVFISLSPEEAVILELISAIAEGVDLGEALRRALDVYEFVRSFSGDGEPPSPPDDGDCGFLWD